MCGISGIYHTSGSPVDESDIKLLTEAMRHRGPDADGIHIDRNIALGHRRLSIVDLSDAGTQPMLSEDKNTALVFNGEIYNHLALRKELETAGYQFNSNCDTEVILHGYDHWGIDILDKLVGMFAFAIWNAREKELILARDHYGMKPLYFYQENNRLAFASELTALLTLKGIDKALDPQAFLDYFSYRYTLAPLTFFKNIKRVPAGHVLHIKNNKGEMKPYTKLSYSEPTLSEQKSIIDYQSELDTLFTEAVHDLLMGDVPIGVLLSGGIDSSTIAHYVHKNGGNLKTYNIGFPEVNEFEYSRAIAKQLNLEHLELTTTVEELLGIFDDVACALDDPIADPACLCISRLCQELKKDVTVVLSGEGGDELFGGYNWHALSKEPGWNRDQIFQGFYAYSSNYLDAGRYMADKQLQQTQYRFKPAYDNEPNSLNGMLHFEMLTWMPENLLMKADKILMSHSLEGRFPFLHKPIVEFANKLPSNLKYHSSQTGKFLLKSLMASEMDERIIKRPKMGFSLPMDLLLNCFKDKVHDTVDAAEKSTLKDVLDFREIRNDVASYYGGGETPFMKVWSLFVMLYWFVNVYKI